MRTPRLFLEAELRGEPLLWHDTPPRRKRKPSRAGPFADAYYDCWRRLTAEDAWRASRLLQTPCDSPAAAWAVQQWLAGRELQDLRGMVSRDDLREVKEWWVLVERYASRPDQAERAWNAGRADADTETKPIFGELD